MINIKVLLPMFLWILLHPSVLVADIWAWFSADLVEARSLLKEKQLLYHELGPLQLRQTVAEAGCQFRMRAAPPPQAPWIQLDLGSKQTFDQIMIVPAIVGQSNSELEPFAFPKRLRVDVSDSEDFASFEFLYVSADAETDASDPFPIVIDAPDTSARYVRLTAIELAQVAKRWTFALSEIMVIRGDRNIALTSNVSMTDSVTALPHWQTAFVVDERSPLGPPIKPPNEKNRLPRSDGVFFVPESKEDEIWFQIDLMKTEAFDAVRLFPVHARLGADYPGYAFPLQFRIEGFSDGQLEQPKLLFRTEGDFTNPGNNPVTVHLPDSSARYVRIVGEQGSLLKSGKIGFAEAQVLRGDLNLAAGKPVESQGWREDRPLRLLVDGDASYGEIVSLAEWASRWKSISKLRLEMRTLDESIAGLTVKAQRRAAWFAASSTMLLGVGCCVFLWNRRRLRIRQQSEFRMQLARDLHDEIGSNLAAIARFGEVGSAVAGDESAREDWRFVCELAGECIKSMQETLWLLGGPKRHDERIADSFRAIANRMLPQLQIGWDIQPAFERVQVDRAAEREIVLMFKAMLANVAKNSNASKVEIAVTDESSGWAVQVRDNGDGFDAARWESRIKEKGMGLESIRQRIRKLGGNFSVESETGEGTCLMITFPNSLQSDEMKTA